MMCKGIPTAVPAEDAAPPTTPIDETPINKAFASAAIADRLAQIADANSAHIRAAAAEAGKSKTIHALTRHGFQTGWAGQLLRICTKLTPDQEYDGLGVLPPETKLESHYRHKIVPEFDAVNLIKMKNRTGGGQAAGMFYNPEIQDSLMKRSIALARTDAMAFPECQVRLLSGAEVWVSYDFIHVYLTHPTGAGVAFAKTAAWVKRDPDVVVEALNDFMTGKKLGDPPRFRFTQWSQLLGFLGVQQVLRNGSRTEITLKGAQPVVMTMMPETVAPGDDGFAPTSIVMPDIDTTGMNKTERRKATSDNAAIYRGAIWTGRLRNTVTGAETNKPVPSWAAPMK